MRGRAGRLAVLALGVVLVAGCASSHPCLIIPMQLKLAQGDVKGYEKQVADKQADVDRMKSSLDMAQSRLQQLRDEEAELQRLIEAAKADSVHKEGK